MKRQDGLHGYIVAIAMYRRESSNWYRGRIVWFKTHRAYYYLSSDRVVYEVDIKGFGRIKRSDITSSELWAMAEHIPMPYGCVRIAMRIEGSPALHK